MKNNVFNGIEICERSFVNWKEIVDYMEQIFVKQGYARAEYFRHVKKDMEEADAYMVIAPHIVLLHTAPQHGALVNAFYFLKLTHPVAFHHECNDPVSLVITFTAADAQSHIDSIRRIACMLMQDAFYEQVMQAHTLPKLEAVIDRYAS